MKAYSYLCAFHARKEAQTFAGAAAGKDIAYHLSACDLSVRPRTPFSAVAQGQIKPKTATTLAYLGQTLVQALHLAQGEYINAYGTNTWRQTIRNSHEQSADPFADHRSPEPPSPAPEPALAPEPAPTSLATPPDPPS